MIQRLDGTEIVTKTRLWPKLAKTKTFDRLCSPPFRYRSQDDAEAAQFCLILRNHPVCKGRCIFMSVFAAVLTQRPVLLRRQQIFASAIATDDFYVGIRE